MQGMEDASAPGGDEGSGGAEAAGGAGGDGSSSDSISTCDPEVAAALGNLDEDALKTSIKNT